MNASNESDWAHSGDCPGCQECDDKPHPFEPSGIPITGEPGQEWCNVSFCTARRNHPIHEAP